MDDNGKCAVFYDPRAGRRPAVLSHDPFPALVAPRPIAWVSTVGAAGQVNLAPFSHFNIAAVDPPMVMFAPNAKDASGTPKDTLRNVREVPQFVVNLASWEHRDAMNRSSRVLEYGESEFTDAGIEPAASINVRPPRVGAAMAALECQVWRIIDLPAGGRGRQCHVVIGEVVGIHIAPEVIVDGRVSAVRLQQLARLGYFEYLVVRDTFEMRRPEG